MGAETTTVGVVSKGIVVKSSVIQFGGKSVDNDIAYIYKIDNQVGQNLK